MKLPSFINLKNIFVLHGLVTLAAGIVLVIDPNLIPSVVGIHLPASSYLVPYLLGTAELCIAAISLGASRLTDVSALRMITWSFIVLHGTTALVEVFAYTQGLDALIWGNIILRIVVIAIFAYFGIYQLPVRSRK